MQSCHGVRTLGNPVCRSAWGVAVACALLAGCGNFSVLGILDAPPPPPPPSEESTLRLYPATVNVLTNGTQRFTATGGTGGYSFSVLEGIAGGSVDSTGLYTAPAAPGTYSVIVTDSSGATSEAVAQVSAAIPLSISPASTTVNAGSVAHFTASGGSGAKIWARTGVGGLTYSGGTADYTAPWQGETSAVISVTDSSGTVTATVTIIPPPALQITPVTADMIAGTSVTFAADGGSGSYGWTTTGSGLLVPGTSTATYTAPGVAETAIKVKVLDANTLLFVEATVNVTVPLPSLWISPSVYTLGAGDSFAFSVGGGTPPYTYSLISAAGTLSPGVNSVTYSAPWTATSGTVRVTDSAASPATADAAISVNSAPPLTITPSVADVTAGNSVTFTPGGGSGSYTLSVASGSGTLVGYTYTTTTAETAVIRLADNNNASGAVDATVNSYQPLTLVPGTATVQVNTTYPFTASGGKPPYSYTVVGGGTMTANVFNAPASPGTSTVRVTDTLLNQSTATVTVQPVVGGWIIAAIDAASRSGQYASLALDSGGLPKIAYYESAARELRLAAFDGTTWSVSTVDTAGRVGTYALLALKPGSGYPGISYYDSTNKQLDYAAWNGSGWNSPQAVDTSGTVGLYTSLAMDSSGNPRISYYDQTNNCLKFASWNGSSWSIQGVNSGGSGGQYTSLALDPTAGYARISFYDSAGHLSLAAWNGSTWTVQVVDPATTTGMYSSLALEPGTGYPRISYYDRSNRDLKFASWNGSSWSIQLIDSTGDVGSYSSVALQPVSKNPGISYYDVTNKSLKYVDASWSGSSWLWNVPQVVDNGGSLNNVGQYSSLAFDPLSGKPRIAYYDQTAQDLKFAKQ